MWTTRYRCGSQSWSDGQRFNAYDAAVNFAISFASVMGCTCQVCDKNGRVIFHAAS